MYEIVVKGKARKAIERLPQDANQRILETVEDLAKDPKPRYARKMRGTGSLEEWRVRIGDYRVVYRIDEEARKVIVLTAGHRGSVYG